MPVIEVPDFTNTILASGTVIGLIGVWYRGQFKIERMEEKFNDLRDWASKSIDENNRQINAIWEWKDQHAKESNDIRERFNKEVSELKGQNLVAIEQFKQVLEILRDIKDRLTRIEEKKQ